MAVRREIAVRLKAEVTDFKKQIGQGAKSLDDLAKKAGGAEKAAQTSLGRMAQSAQLQRDSWDRAGGALTAFGAVAAAGVGMAVAAFADFDAQMSAVQAATHESTTNMGLLRDAAMQAGADTAFSASEAAQGVEELAKAGVSTADILGGGLAGALDLAAAGSLGVAEAAETTASMLTQFGLDGGKATHVADLLAAGAGKAQGSVHDMGAALDQAGLVANQTGLTIEETTGTLAMFASAGLTGSDAGTSFKTMLQALTPTSEKAREAMSDLGISAWDAQGNFIGMSEFAGVLQGALKDMSVEQQNATLKTIFGADAVRAASLIFQEGAAGVEEWEGKVNDAGFAAETAAIKTDNLQGDLERLGGAWDTLMIGMGEGANSPLRMAVQGLESMLDWAGRLPQPILNVATGLGGVAAAAGLSAGAFLLLFPRAMDTFNAFQQLKTVNGPLATGLGKVGKAAGAVGVAAVGTVALGTAIKFLVDQAGDIDRTAQGVEEVTSALMGARESGEFYNATFSKMAESGAINVRMFEDLGKAADEVANQNWADKFFGGLDMDATGISDVAKQFETMGQALAAMPLEDAQAKFKAMWAEAGGGAEAGENLLESMPAYREAIYAAGNAAGVTGEDFDLLAWATGDAGDAAEAAAPKFDLTTEAADRQVVTLEELLELQRDVADVAMGVSAAEIAFQESIDAATDALKENGASLDLNTEAGRANRSALDGIAASGWDAVEALDANGASTEDVRAKMQSARDAFIETATQMGMTGEAANALADEYGLIPSKIQTEAELEKAQAEADLAALAKQIEGLPNGVVSIETVGYAQTYQYLSSIQSAMSTINGTRVRIGMGAGGSGGTTFADGGPVFGPGTSTSDSIPARLSNGEYVIKADSVQHYGRHFFDSVNAQRFASGGLVGSSPQVSVAAPSLDGMRLTGRLDLGNGLSGFVDGRIESALDREGAWSR